ncbi:hypothetical protein HT031_002484 [Scenedesmus sp. PABB004]|nr:hypothetical protein HT031_002484 [Scenedesmus sp. PABB004]
MDVLSMFTSSKATTRLAVVMVLLTGLSWWARNHVAALPRPSFTGLEAVEDAADASGTRVRVLSRGPSSGGARSEVELLIRPTAKGFYPGFAGSWLLHSHDQEEALAVAEGVLGVSIAGALRNVTAGEVVVVPQGAPHSIWCAGDAPVLVRQTFTPAGRADVAAENLAGLARTYGDVTKIHPLQLVALLDGAGIRLEGMPGFMSWALHNVLAPFARYVGFASEYPAYASAGAPAGSVDEE